MCYSYLQGTKEGHVGGISIITRDISVSLPRGGDLCPESWRLSWSSSEKVEESHGCSFISFRLFLKRSFLSEASPGPLFTSALLCPNTKTGYEVNICAVQRLLRISRWWQQNLKPSTGSFWTQVPVQLHIICSWIRPFQHTHTHTHARAHTIPISCSWKQSPDFSGCDGILGWRSNSGTLLVFELNPKG